MDHRQRLEGVFPPMSTPFRDQKLDLDAVRYNIERMNPTGIRGYMPLGSNGEFRSLSDDEAIALVRVYRQCIAPGKTLIVGAGRESAYTTTEFVLRAADAGADYVSVVTPHYFPKMMTDAALCAFYTYVADRSPVPVLLYCVPGYANGVVISPDAVHALCAHPNIAGMKDTSKEDIAGYCNAAAGLDFYVLAGTVKKFLYGLQCGAIGGVLSIANYLPELCVQLQQAYREGRQEEAAALSERLLSLNKRTTETTGVAGVKASMDLLGYRGQELRLPLLPLPAEQKEALAAVLAEEGLL